MLIYLNKSLKKASVCACEVALGTPHPNFPPLLLRIYINYFGNQTLRLFVSLRLVFIQNLPAFSAFIPNTHTHSVQSPAMNFFPFHMLPTLIMSRHHGEHTGITACVFIRASSSLAGIRTSAKSA